VTIRLAVGLFLLSSGDRQYVLSSDDGDAYVASARYVALNEPITLDDRLAAKWPDAQSEDPAERWPQAYWLFLAAQYRLLGYQHVSAIVMQAFFGGLTVLAGYSIAGSSRAAAALLIALSSTLVQESAALYAEALY